MSLRQSLWAVAETIAVEAEQNPAFRNRLERALGLIMTTAPEVPDKSLRRKRRRRAAATLDPIEIARRNENELRDRLTELDLDQLRDIVAEYGMDPGKLVMKWKNSSRVVERIIELAAARARKGEAFRAD